MQTPKLSNANNSKTIEKFYIPFHICGIRMTRSVILIPPPLQDSPRVVNLGEIHEFYANDIFYSKLRRQIELSELWGRINDKHFL